MEQRLQIISALPNFCSAGIFFAPKTGWFDHRSSPSPPTTSSYSKITAQNPFSSKNNLSYLLSYFHTSYFLRRELVLSRSFRRLYTKFQTMAASIWSFLVAIIVLYFCNTTRVTHGTVRVGWSSKECSLLPTSCRRYSSCFLLAHDLCQYFPILDSDSLPATILHWHVIEFDEVKREDIEENLNPCDRLLGRLWLGLEYDARLRYWCQPTVTSN